jgi:hypothetical protein
MSPSMASLVGADERWPRLDCPRIWSRVVLPENWDRPIVSCDCESSLLSSVDENFLLAEFPGDSSSDILSKSSTGCEGRGRFDGDVVLFLDSGKEYKSRLLSSFSSSSSMKELCRLLRFDTDRDAAEPLGKRAVMFIMAHA